jgi:hypothetical protein
LANHGILPHNGRGITREIMVKALVGTFNVDIGLAKGLFDKVSKKLGTIGSDGKRQLDLSSLRNHGVIEHDASLTRKDYGDLGNDNFTVQKSLVDQLKTFAVDGKEN